MSGSSSRMVHQQGPLHRQHHHQQQQYPNRHYPQHLTPPQHTAQALPQQRATASQLNSQYKRQQTPPSAQHYKGSIASVKRQQRFRRQQEEFFPHQHQQLQQQQQGRVQVVEPPKIGLDYIDHGQGEERGSNSNHHRGSTQSPLVLDPSAVTPLPSNQHQQSAHPSKSSNAKSYGMMHNLLRGIGVSSSPSSSNANPQNQPHGPQKYDQEHQQKQHPSSTSTCIPPLPPPPTATEFARRAPQAGFLQKMGTNIPTYKRRFFVLQPTTQLYYFLSPHDTIPRGAIAVDDATIKVEDTNNNNKANIHNDGTTRFALEWPDGRQIQLEARSPELAQAWSTALQQERLPYVRAQLESTQQELAQARYEIADLERQVDDYRFVEQDRDGALEDARRWKDRFESLDEALRLLANHVRKLPAAPSSSPTTNTLEDKDGMTQEKNDGNNGSGQSTRQNNIIGDGEGKGSNQEEEPTAATTGAERFSTTDPEQQDRAADATPSIGPEAKSMKDRICSPNRKEVSLKVGGKSPKPEEKARANDCDVAVESSAVSNKQQEEERSTTTDPEQQDRAADATPSIGPEAKSMKDRICSPIRKEVSLKVGGKSPKPEEKARANDCDVAVESSAVSNKQQEEERSTTKDDPNNDGNTSRRDVSLLDDDAAAEAAAAFLFENNNIIEDLSAPGQHFPSLVNACQQLRENLRLASEEATTAVEDTKTAQLHAKALQSRMAKAEKQLCQLWEENCSIRKTLKQKKREKRVLVREVKSLMEKEQQHEAAKELELRHRSGRAGMTTPASRAIGEDDASTVIGSDEERLINELEEHVVSSIRLHEEFLSAGGKSFNQQPKREISATKRADLFGAAPSSGSTATTSESTHSGMGLSKMTHQSTNSSNTTAIAQNMSKKSKDSNLLVEHHQDVPLASLLDRSASDSESETEDYDVNDDPQLFASAQRDGKSSPPRAPPSFMFANSEPEDGIVMKRPVYDEIDGRSISSVAASFGGDSCSSVGRSRESTPLRPNPVLQLDKSEEEQERIPHRMDEAQRFKPISVAQRGNATSRLVCPLADVVQTKPKRMMRHGENIPAGAAESSQDFQIYHLTFYTRKIGLQFQKVPAPPARSRGLLTAAMTADLAGDAYGGCKTAAELKRVASIWAKSTGDGAPDAAEDADTCLQVASPIDAVLVCGFDGFDDSGNNVRPKLGARLVAFDGVSVEVGKWTFDSIRNSIKARGRPLTLSFRNDFLTVDQREIMTKVVAQMEKVQPQATPYSRSQPCDVPVAGTNVEYHGHENLLRPLSATPSLQPVSSHETAHFVNETTLKTSNTIHVPSDPGHDVDDDLTVSTTGYYSDYNHYNNNPPEPYHQNRSRRFTASSGGSYNSSSRPGSYKYMSFSEAGSSASALSSAIGPLLSNLLSAEKKQVKMDPDYLHRRDSVENAPQHQDFQSNLL